MERPKPSSIIHQRMSEKELAAIYKKDKGYSLSYIKNLKLAKQGEIIPMNLYFKLPAKYSIERQLQIITQTENRKGVLHASITEENFNKTLEIEISKMSYQDVLDLGAFLAENTIVY